MTEYWWKDLFDRNDHWQGLELTLQENPKIPLALEMLSGCNGRMALQAGAEMLFWASMREDHSGAWVVFNTDHPGSQGLLPAVTSQNIERIKSKGQEAWSREWCRFFSHQLMHAPVPLLSSHRWLLSPMVQTPRSSPYSLQQSVSVKEWRFDSPESVGNVGVRWTLYGEDFPDLVHPQKVRLADWWWGNDLLLGRYPIDADAGRLKWWRKKCREGTLPPILIWFIGGLGSFVILDGHYRLQAAITEEIPPSFLVVSELNERVIAGDPVHRERILRALEKQQRNNTEASINAINQTLINLYDTRYFYASTRSRAILGEGTRWAQELDNFLQKHHLEAYREKIFSRVNDYSGRL
ncbi:hypothetical protein [Citrobacter sp. FP75]|uniref:hypothetical protein n=1 Tax=Citrobacter sp. FP75 TaxID=1852949 RepID=UPI001BC98B02|nr:hypothetical protein [Citrobacter sp. FP75]